MEPTSLDDLRDLLEENIKATEENTRLLKAMRRDALIGGILKTLVWVLAIIASLYFTFQYLEPMLAPFTEAASGFSPEQYQALFEQYRSQFGQ